MKTNASPACANILAIHHKQYQANKKKYEYVLETGRKLDIELFLNFLVIWIQPKLLMFAASVH